MRGLISDRTAWCSDKRRRICVRVSGDMPLAAIWNDPNSSAQFRHEEEHLTDPCAKCPFGSRCKAGCSAMAISQAGVLTETPFCIRQLESERIIKEMAEIRQLTKEVKL